MSEEKRHRDGYQTDVKERRVTCVGNPTQVKNVVSPPPPVNALQPDFNSSGGGPMTDEDAYALRYMKERFPVMYDDLLRIQREAFEVLAQKNHDYGDKNITLGGDVHNSEADKQFALTAVVIRLNDKMERLKNIVKNEGRMMVDESMEDTLMDAMNYATIALCVYRGTWAR